MNQERTFELLNKLIDFISIGRTNDDTVEILSSNDFTDKEIEDLGFKVEK